MNTVTLTAGTYYLLLVLLAVGFLVAPTLTVYLRSWEESFPSWTAATVGSAIIISAAIVAILRVVPAL